MIHGKATCHISAPQYRWTELNKDKHLESASRALGPVLGTKETNRRNTQLMSLRTV